MTHPAIRILEVLRDLGPDALFDEYGICRADEPETAPLDAAILDWLDAGAPMPGDPPSTSERIKASFDALALEMYRYERDHK